MIGLLDVEEASSCRLRKYVKRAFCGMDESTVERGGSLAGGPCSLGGSFSESTGGPINYGR